MQNNSQNDCLMYYQPTHSHVVTSARNDDAVSELLVAFLLDSDRVSDLFLWGCKTSRGSLREQWRYRNRLC
jgi:hypothetical protein